MNINWDFIAAREGRKLQGYVPDPETSHSGVTIGIGVDLGQKSVHDLAGLNPDLAKKLTPYLGHKGMEAAAFLETHPLSITKDEADALNDLARTGLVGAMAAHFSQASGKRFEDLPEACQTVLASVDYQYGTPWVKCPRFWNAAIHLNWHAAEYELRNFGDQYDKRHELEADYLKSHLYPSG